MRGEERREAKRPSKPVGQRGPSLAGLGGELGLMPPASNQVPARCPPLSKTWCQLFAHHGHVCLGVCASPGGGSVTARYPQPPGDSQGQQPRCASSRSPPSAPGPPLHLPAQRA